MRSHFPFVTKKRALGMLDNIYVLNYLVNRQVSRVGGKMVAFFIALRTTFDSVDRERLVKAMRERCEGGGAGDEVRGYVKGD